MAIDGPAGAGKSTVARSVARQLQVAYVDTGAIYRSLTWEALRRGVSLDSERTLGDLAVELKIEFIPNDEQQKVWVRGEDLTEAIRMPVISANVAKVAAYPLVRERLLAIQRTLAEGAGGVVMDGRDIGTRIMPHADVKVFLTASAGVRAKRRYDELVEQGHALELPQVLEELEDRDRTDQSRQVAPLRPAADAVVLDTSPLSVEEVCAMVVALCEIRSRNKEGR